MIPNRRCVLPWLGLLVLVVSGCVTGGGGSVGLYTNTRGDVGAAVRGHATALGFRVSGRPDSSPAGAPLLGAEGGVAFSFRQPVWRLQFGVPIAGTWDDTEADHGIRIAPQLAMDLALKYDGSTLHDAWGGALAGAYLRHVAMESEQYEGPDAMRIHRMGPVFSAAFFHDDEGWFGNFFLGFMYDFEAWVATGG